MGVKNILSFNEDDFVVVAGTTITNDGNNEQNMSIAQVVGVGQEELFLKCSRTGRIFKRPLVNCYKIKSHPTVKNSIDTSSPVLGDLVLSYSGNRYSQNKKIIGILIEIIDNPPNDVEARILCGEETHVVPFHSVIVVEGK